MYIAEKTRYENMKYNRQEQSGFKASGSVTWLMAHFGTDKRKILIL